MTEVPPTERIRVVPAEQLPLGRWLPEAGAATLGLSRRATDLSPEEWTTVLTEASNILSRCPHPGLTVGRITGLAVGRIQSGKTMSYSTLAALASDNGYRMIIVITGTSIPLLNQSVDRLRTDLGVEDQPWMWQHFINPRPENGPIVAAALAQWADETIPREEKRTVLITVMKNTRHLRALSALLRTAPLDGVPVLVIDDEADQAGLNTFVNAGSASATYRRIRELRDLLPNHAYLEYTATPQAPLLINIIDSLSPQFAEILTPGENYAGGRSFFADGPGSLIRAIPTDELPREEVTQEAPPDSLLDALRIFFLGVAAEATKPVAERETRSMIVHPTRLVAGHSDYYQWIVSVQRVWSTTLRGDASEADRAGLIEEFRPAYTDLSTTVAALPKFEDLAALLGRVISTTIVTEMNASRGKTPGVEWERGYSHILVGGQAMDRGFTARGLTVTYMPRGTGTGQADTIQQRGRFFGYKRGYLGFCRVYLDADVEGAFRKYVEHEDDVHARLVAHKATGNSLSEWKRVFFLDRSLKPTRDSVIDIAYRRAYSGTEWEWPKFPQDPEDAVETNRRLVETFLSRLQLRPVTTTTMTGFQSHLVANRVPLREVYESLLVPYRLGDPEDSQRWVGMLLHVESYIHEHADAHCSIIQMSGGQRRERTLDPQGRIPTLFQGPTEAADGPHYPGDSKVLAEDGALTVQVHYLDLKANQHPDPDAIGGRDNVVALAVWIPSSMGLPLLIQPQGRIDGGNGR